MGTNPSRFKSVAGQDTSRFPVESVSWNDAVEFCKKLSEKDGVTYRLPTEAEWEYACRAGTTTTFHFGSMLNGDKANVNGSNPYGTATKGPFLQRTTTVGLYPKNAFGLFDMHGNVWEWCEDVYDEKAYASRSGTTTDPKATSGSESRVVRGGAWFNVSRSTRSAYRNRYTPDGRTHLVGFRVVRSVAPTTAAGNAASPLAVTNNTSTPVATPTPSVALKASPAAAVAKQLLDAQQRIAIERKLPVDEQTKIGLTLKLIVPMSLADPSPFYLGVYEVTQKEYQSVRLTNPSAFSNQPKSTGGAKVRGLITDNFPVDSVGWTDAAKFCNGLSIREGLPAYYTVEKDTIRVIGGTGYRLPTTKEWWYVSQQAGATSQPFDDYCWHNGNAGGRSHQVGTKKPNVWGLFDMHGNVGELCWTVPGTTKSEDEGNVVPGGSWVHGAAGCKGSTSVWKNFKAHDVGFRVARDGQPRKPK